MVRLIGLWIVGLLLAVLLAACGSDDPILQLPTTTSEAIAANVTSVAAPGDSPVAATVTPVVNNTLKPTIPATDAPAPTTTPAPPTPTNPPAPTTTPEPPTPTNSPNPTSTSSPVPATTRPPTVSVATATPARIDPAAELKVIQAAYDAINKHFYTQPDTAVLSQKGLEEAAKALNVTPPVALAWTSNPDTNWQQFEQQFEQMAAKSEARLSQGEVAHRVASAFALAIGDLHTYFLDQKRTDTINRMGRGDNTTLGFGLSFVLYQNAYYVQRMVTGSPGQLAGVRVGDQLVQFDGVTVDSTNFSRLSNATEGRAYDFVFKPRGAGVTVPDKIEYKRYNVPTVEWQLLKNHIGFITINAFHLDVATRLDEAISAVKGQGADSLVIDLRYNGGGYNFDSVSGRFVANGTVLGKFTNRAGSPTLKARSEGKQVTPLLPLVVLIERNSASASEVFSLAIRDFQAGTLIGGKSAGALGTVAYWPLGDGTSLGVTNSVYESAKGVKLNGIGVTPDITVTWTTEDILNGRDPQLEAAVTQLETKAKVTH